MLGAMDAVVLGAVMHGGSATNTSTHCTPAHLHEHGAVEAVRDGLAQLRDCQAIHDALGAHVHRVDHALTDHAGVVLPQRLLQGEPAVVLHLPDGLVWSDTRHRATPSGAIPSGATPSGATPSVHCPCFVCVCMANTVERHTHCMRRMVVVVSHTNQQRAHDAWTQR